MKSARFFWLVIAWAAACAGASAFGQRIQFVSPETGGVYQPAASQASPGYVPPYSAGPTPQVPPPSTFAPGPSGGTAVPSPAAPTYSPGVAPPPAAAFEGNILPPPTWDPYAPPGSQSPTLIPQDPYFPGGATPAPGPSEGLWTKMVRFRQEARLEYIWMPGNGTNELGLNDFDLHGTFAIPLMYNTETPLLVTPGFGLQLWNGPVSTTADLPSRTYDAYLDAAWNPQVTPILGGELGFTVGVYSDFNRVTEDSIRYQGRGLVTLAFSPSFTVKAGVIYLDRLPIKLLPAGGIIWVPDGNPDVRFEVLFPNPRLAMRLATDSRNTEWWFYVRGEYGGSAWTVKRQLDVDLDGIIDAEFPDEVGYNDIRAAVGFEFDSYSGMDGLVEVGVAFERELFYKSTGRVECRPNPTLFVGGQLAF